MGSFNSTFNSSVFNANTDSLELQTLLHHSYDPEHKYYLRVKSHMSWSTFVELLGEPAADWIACKQCARTWEYLSTLSDGIGQPVIFRDRMSVYPEYAWNAIAVFKESFRATDYSDSIVYYPPKSQTYDGINFGTETSGGHIHLFLESHLHPTDDKTQFILDKYQRIIRVVLTHLESTAKHPKSQWSADFFNQASESTYGTYTDEIVTFCLNMARKIKNNSARMLRPALIEELDLLCVTLDNDLDEQELLKTVLHVIKVFRRRATIKYSVRETIFRNFILDPYADKSTYEWPTISTYAERIVAIGLHECLWQINSMDDEDDSNIESVIHKTCIMMNVTVDHEQPLQYKLHLFGLALREYVDGKPIIMGENQHRLQVLYYSMTGNVQSMPGLTTTESFAVMFTDSSTDLPCEILAGFLDTPLGSNETETLHNALYNFTNKSS
jgi:hypothetical protein